jgi:hypothetical protein
MEFRSFICGDILGLFAASNLHPSMSAHVFVMVAGMRAIPTLSDDLEESPAAEWPARECRMRSQICGFTHGMD